MTRTWTPALLIAGIVAVWAALAFIPANSWPGPDCLVRKTTGVHCPGCGGTRAARHLVSGDWMAAARHNVLVYPVVLGLLWGAVALAANRWAGKHWRMPLQISRRMMLILLIVITVFTLVRNIDWAWFLRP